MGRKHWRCWGHVKRPLARDGFPLLPIFSLFLLLLFLSNVAYTASDPNVHDSQDDDAFSIAHIKCGLISDEQTLFTRNRKQLEWKRKEKSNPRHVDKVFSHGVYRCHQQYELYIQCFYVYMYVMADIPAKDDRCACEHRLICKNGRPKVATIKCKPKITQTTPSNAPVKR